MLDQTERNERELALASRAPRASRPALTSSDPTPDATWPHQRRALLIAYHFGPDSATGAFRWTHLIPHLVELGWGFDVIALERPGQAYARVDPDAAATHAVEVFPVPIPASGFMLERWSWAAIGVAKRVLAQLKRSESASQEPADSAAVVDEASGPSRVFVLDPRMRRPPKARLAADLVGASEAFKDFAWERQAVALGRRLIAARRHRVIVVSSPPHVTQIVGARLTRSSGVPYVADYRDPWFYGIGPTNYADDIWRFIGRRYEPRTQGRARIVVHNTERAQHAVEHDLKNTVKVQRTSIPNGSDIIGSEVGYPDTDVFRLVYTGELHPFMDVRVLLDACGRLRRRFDLGRDRFRVEFMGTNPQFGGVELAALARHYGLGEVFQLYPRGPRAGAVALQESAAVLAAFDCPHPLCIPAKFYDYMRMRGALLLLGHVQGAMADAAARIGARVYAIDDSDGIDAALDAAWMGWQERRLTEPNDRDGVFDRRHTAHTWHRLLESLRAGSTG